MKYFAMLKSNQGAISLKLLGGKLAPKLIHFVLRKELLRLSEMAPRTSAYPNIPLSLQ